MEIPRIRVEDVLAETADAQIRKGAAEAGLLALTGVDATLGLDGPRKEMLRFFGAGADARSRTLRNKYDATRPNVYRGFFPAEPQRNAMVEGFDIGPDVADPMVADDGGDPLTEPTPDPGIPGWRESAAIYHRTLGRLGTTLTRSLLRGIDADAAVADKLFERGNSTLRLLRYPPTRSEHFGSDRRIDGFEDRFAMTKRHTDSGFVTLLWQDATGGLQAETSEGWVDVPPEPGGLVANFGQMLEDWSGGRIRATPHRVIGGAEERYSVPFFLEPAVDAVIAPLFPDSGRKAFVYGDFLWERMVSFPNFHGVKRRPAASAGLEP